MAGEEPHAWQQAAEVLLGELSRLLEDRDELRRLLATAEQDRDAALARVTQLEHLNQVLRIELYETRRPADRRRVGSVATLIVGSVAALGALLQGGSALHERLAAVEQRAVTVTQVCEVNVTHKDLTARWNVEAPTGGEVVLKTSGAELRTDLRQTVVEATDARFDADATQPAQRERPRLVLQRGSGQAFVAVNIGDRDAVDVRAEPAPNTPSPRALIIHGEPLERLSPGGSWQVGLYAPSADEAAQPVVLLSWRDDAGERFEAHLPVPT